MKPWFGTFLVLATLIIGASSASAAEDRQALAAKAKRYWAAEVEQDYGTIYDLLGSANRERISRDDFIATLKDGPVRFVTAEVGEIIYADDLAWVRVKFDWLFVKHANAGARPGNSWHLWRNAEGWYPIVPTERDQWPTLPPTLRPAAEEAVLKERVLGLWQAKAKEDWKAVYAYMPPWFKELNPPEKFLRSKAMFLYSSPAIQWVEVQGSEARAAIEVGSRPNDPATTKLQPRVAKLIEPWYKVDGIWYLKVITPEEQRPSAQGKPELNAGARK